MDQPKIERLLRIMQLLRDRTRINTIESISRTLDISPRTVYRYLDTFENAGFRLEKKENSVSLARESKYFRMISDLAYFNQEEAYIIKKALEVYDSNNQAVLGVKKKLNNIYDFRETAPLLVKPGRDRVISSLLFAIAEERQVILKDYHSIHTSKISDRHVEPISFGVNMSTIYCYEIESGMCKYYGIPRIGEVIVEENEWKNRENHIAVKADIFRFSGSHPKHIKLKMSMVAATLLAEEFPLSEQYVKVLENNEFMLECDVYDFQGAARFVLGLCNEIEVLGNDEFIGFLDEKRKRSKF